MTRYAPVTSALGLILMIFGLLMGFPLALLGKFALHVFGLFAKHVGLRLHVGPGQDFGRLANGVDTTLEGFDVRPGPFRDFAGSFAPGGFLSARPFAFPSGFRRLGPFAVSFGGLTLGLFGLIGLCREEDESGGRGENGKYSNLRCFHG